jgi:glycine dehydrogenase subunit 2
VYFPLLVEEAIMVEPPESESKEEVDSFIEAMISVAKEAKENPERFKEAPYGTIVSRLDETLAARKPVLRWNPAE